jgi:hypothetical protein
MKKRTMIFLHLRKNLLAREFYHHKTLVIKKVASKTE